MVGSDKGVNEDYEILRKYTSLYSEYKVISEKKYKEFEVYKNKKDSWYLCRLGKRWL
jgi:hypothetical protein